MASGEAASREWAWQLESGHAVRARLDLAERVESVWIGPRLVSRSPPGGKPGGHAIDLARGGAAESAAAGPVARVEFRGDGCTLTVDGRTVIPSESPTAYGAVGALAPMPLPPPTSRRNALSGVGVLVAVVSATVAATTSHRLTSGLFAGSVESQLEVAARELNRQCPMPVDKETRLDNALAGPGKVFTYNFTLVTLSGLTPPQIERLKAAVVPLVTNRARSGKETKSLLDQGVALHYRYSDQAGVLLFEMSVDP